MKSLTATPRLCQPSIIVGNAARYTDGFKAFKLSTQGAATVKNVFKREFISHRSFAGKHSKIIVPPSWIVKLPRKGSFKSSLRKSPKKKLSNKKKNKERVSTNEKVFFTFR